MNDDFMNMLANASNESNNINPVSSALSTMIPGLLSTLFGDPEMMQEVIRNTIKQYKPVIYSVIDELLIAYEDAACSERFFKIQAQMKSQAHKAYMDAGFTDEQATLFLLDSDITRKKLLNQIATAWTKVSTS